LHGNAPDKADVALLLIDVINDLDFPEGDQLLEHALPMARQLVALKRRAKRAGVPVIYANDNFGRWRSDFSAQVQHCLDDGARGKTIVELLRPDDDDYFVLKPKHSGFFSTTLGILLDYLQVNTVILTGIAGNICVLFTANDAYMRDFSVIVPEDCVASNTEEENRHALMQMRTVLKADTRPSTEPMFRATREKTVSRAPVHQRRVSVGEHPEGVQENSPGQARAASAALGSRCPQRFFPP
jgi:nicotinamidase-related amidase